MSKQKQDDAFIVTHDMIAKLRDSAGVDLSSPRGKQFTGMLQTLLVTRAINRLTLATQANTAAIEKQTSIIDDARCD